jgi:hypothetical protein
MLAGLLRIADGLDVRHLGTVTEVAAVQQSGRVLITAQAEGDVTGELGKAMERADLFERTFGVRVAVEALEGARA